MAKRGHYQHTLWVLPSHHSMYVLPYSQNGKLPCGNLVPMFRMGERCHYQRTLRQNRDTPRSLFKRLFRTGQDGWVEEVCSKAERKEEKESRWGVRVWSLRRLLFSA